MTRNAILSGALLIGMGVSASAQQPTPRPTGAMGIDDKRLTVTGCLQTDEASGNGRFLLVNAREGSSPGGGSAVTSPTPPGSGSTESAARAGATQPPPIEENVANRLFVLHGQTQDLALHAGQQVEISGLRMSSSVDSAGATATSGTAGGADNSDRVKPSRNDRPTIDTGAHTQEAQELEVTSVRMVASVCAVR